MTLEESWPSVRFRPPSNKDFVDISDARQQPNEKKKRLAPSNADLAYLPKLISLSGNLGRFKTTREDLSQSIGWSPLVVDDWTEGLLSPGILRAAQNGIHARQLPVGPQSDMILCSRR